MNRLMTAGQDIRWRREVIRRAQLTPGAQLLDLGAGTGDLAREALRQQQDCSALAADFTLGMMRVGQKHAPPTPDWSAADALALPFADQRFDAVVSGYLLRNVSDLRLVGLAGHHPPGTLLVDAVHSIPHAHGHPPAWLADHRSA
jgi:demethylmenaquinone methyltransferase/2-methoxy-6-polyprenyl-1,4-benzoquinol methylase